MSQHNLPWSFLKEQIKTWKRNMQRRVKGETNKKGLIYKLRNVHDNEKPNRKQDLTGTVQPNW